MDHCDALIVGGGPAGSSCAWSLRNAGLDVVVMDKMAFPRDKVCAGWITPAVIEALHLDVEEYRQQRVLQPITGFRVSLLEEPAVETSYDRAVSFGIRRCEFDFYLLQRSGARLHLGEPVRNLARTGNGWLINESLQSPVIVGAGGHFCPVARFLGADVGGSELAVKAQEIEFKMNPAQQAACRIKAGVPELFFCKDLKGYGWGIRKGDYLNIGLGRENDHSLSQQVSSFHDFLVREGRVPPDLAPRFKGHAYLLYQHAKRKLVDDGVLLVGDAAGLAYSQSGEGIRPAIESGLLAAMTILQAGGHYPCECLKTYERQLQHRLGPRNTHHWSDWLPPGFKQRLAATLFGSHWFTHHVILDRWFLHNGERPLRDHPAG